MQERPLVLLDSAHNPVEARSSGAHTARHVASRGARLHLVCGILADKDQASMVRALAAVATRVTVTQPPLPSASASGQDGRLFRKALG